MGKKHLTPEVAELAKIKEKRGWSYHKLASELGLHDQTVVAWILGKSKPSPLALRVLNQFLKKSR
jgi:DNA-binding transcriptional regulator YiaG